MGGRGELAEVEWGRGRREGVGEGGGGLGVVLSGVLGEGGG